MKTETKTIIGLMSALLLCAMAAPALAQPDLIVTDIGPDCIFADLTNVLTAQVKNTDLTNNAGSFNVAISITNVSGTVYSNTANVPSLAANTSTVVSLGNWKPALENITITVVADCDGWIVETDEGNNASVEQRTTTGDCDVDTMLPATCYGYRGQHPLQEIYSDAGKHGLIYTTGDYKYKNETVNFNIGADTNEITGATSGIPVGATIKYARLYDYFCYRNTGSSPNPGLDPRPDYDMSIDGNSLTADEYYTDMKGFKGSKSQYGTLAYDVTDYVTGDGTYQAVRSNYVYGKGYTSGMALLIVYEDPSCPYIEYHINEGYDRLATVYKSQYHVLPEDATTIASFPYIGHPPADILGATLFTATTDTNNASEALDFNDDGPWSPVWSGSSSYPIATDSRSVVSELQTNTAGNPEIAEFQENVNNGFGATNAILIVEKVPPNATVFFVPDDIRLPKYCDTTNVGIWIDTEEVITSGRMEFDYADCCMNVTGYEMNTTNWVPGSSDMVLTSGKVRTTLLAPGSGVGPGLLHVGDITVHCCNDTGYCFTDLTWNKTGGAAGFYLWNDASAMLDFIDWQDGTFRCNIPDLTITMVKGNEINATHYNVSYTVKNVGEVDAAASYANLLVDGSQVETMPIPVLTPGEEKAYSFSSEIEQTGTVDSLLVCADYDDAVVELDEDNNCMKGRYPGEVVIKVQPVVTYVQPQDQFDVKIYVDTKGIDVYAVQYRLTYNTSIVRAETQNKDTFLGPISETMVVVNEISQPYGEVSYAETRKVPGAVTESDNVTNIHFIAIGVRGATTPLTLDDIIISDEDGVAIAYVIEDGEVVITENTAPVPVGVTKHRINNVAQKYQSTAILCSCSYDPDYPGKGGNITYIRWAFGDGQYGTSEGLPVDNCTCKEHKYESWQWDPLNNPDGDYVPFDVQLEVTDDGCPELTNTTNFTIDVYIAGDANGDGEVNILDAVWVGKHWRATCGTTCLCENCEGYLWDDEQKDGADLNNDCEINILDAVIVGANWRHVAW